MNPQPLLHKKRKQEYFPPPKKISLKFEDKVLLGIGVAFILFILIFVSFASMIFKAQETMRKSFYKEISHSTKDTDKPFGNRHKEIEEDFNKLEEAFKENHRRNDEAFENAVQNFQNRFNQAKENFERKAP